MSKKYTQEYIKNLFIKNNYVLLNEYKNGKSTLLLKDKDGYICTTCLNSFKKGNNPSKFHSNNPYTIQNIKLWMKTNAIGYALISKEYKNAKEDLLFKCPKCNKYFYSNWSSFKQGVRCGVCTGNQITLETCIATTHPWMIDLGMSRYDAETHTFGSEDKVVVTCPNCGRQKNIRINQIYNKKSIGCICGDGVSYPEKFVISILNQLNIEYIKEYKPEWSNGKRYDFYLTNCNSIIECHGEQHYKGNFERCGGNSLLEEQNNDNYKKQLALDNGIYNYIILDCSISNLEQIKNSIINSKLSNMFNLSNIDWLKCEEFALSNQIKNICDYWNLHNEINHENLTTTDIGKVFGFDKNTICRYLKKGQNLGWCNYKANEESTKIRSKNGKNNSKPIEVFKDGKSLGIFSSCIELSSKSQSLFGVKLLIGCISLVCNGKQKQHKGFTFKYI